MNQVDVGSRVRHPQHGTGTVQMCQGVLAIVEFDEPGLQRVEVGDLELLASATRAVGRDHWDPPIATTTRLLAESILSVNDAWGVFAPSNIDLLPHQLWVCKKVNQFWPTRWLVADDVGLGKTIEAGLILWPLLSRGQVRRVLVLTPASLVDQWRERMYEMFDIRLQAYRADEDRGRVNFWERENQVVASFHTLRLDRNQRHERILKAPPWDLVIVDEAHHLNSDEELGPTRTYRFVQQLEEAGLIESMVFFTGTPHRGKDWGFLSLMQLLRKELFNPRKPAAEQLGHLPSVMIRNNKYSVTDLEGRRLFQPPKVRQIDYKYSSDEQDFYDLISDFIQNGYAYSNRLNVTMGNAVTLVLIAIQKLAASSVAAVLRALRKRLQLHGQRRTQRDSFEAHLEQIREASANLDLDRAAELEAALAEIAGDLVLMEDEVPHLEELIVAAERVRSETKIELILDLLEKEYAGRQVLFFTEYKATQSLLLSRLNARFGEGLTAFINGDERAEEVRDAEGQLRTLRMPRAEAAEAFNSGKATYLISTEAGGEGIDLQERCHTLIHVDLPWNPMRMHQRVGRLNRYGQKRQVEVAVVRNRATVESRIFDRLTEKIHSINRAFDEVMEEPEDLFNLILGFASGQFFNDLYASARRSFSGDDDDERLSRWFDFKTGSFGGQDAIATVKGLIGNVARFNFQQVSEDLPKVNLPDLKPFFEAMLTLNHRRPTYEGHSLSFITPDEWREERGIQPRYSGLHFDRTVRDREARKGILGVGQRLMDLALSQARGRTETLTGFTKSSQPGPLFVFRIRDRITRGNTSVRFQIAGVHDNGKTLRLLKDWELVLQLNSTLERGAARDEPQRPLVSGEQVESGIDRARSFLESRLPSMDLPFQHPDVEVLGTIWK